VIISVHNNENVLLTFYSAIETAICSSSFVNPADSGNVLVIFFAEAERRKSLYFLSVNFCHLFYSTLRTNFKWNFELITVKEDNLTVSI